VLRLIQNAFFKAILSGFERGFASAWAGASAHE
jgi:hypothetical protein